MREQKCDVTSVLIRKILFEIQKANDLSGNPEIPGYAQHLIANHLDLLHRAGFLEVTDVRYSSVKKFFISDLTWSGHDLAGMFKNDEVWNELLEKFSADQLSDLPIEVIKETATRLTQKWANAKAGVV
jgi:Hypothetical protein (DUF2513)